MIIWEYPPPMQGVPINIWSRDFFEWPTRCIEKMTHLLPKVWLGVSAKRGNQWTKISHFLAFCSLTKNAKFSLFAKFPLLLFREKMLIFAKLKKRKFSKKISAKFRENVCEIRTKILAFFSRKFSFAENHIDS